MTTAIPGLLTTCTADQLIEMIEAGGRASGRPALRAAAHLLAYTQLPRERGSGLIDLLDVEDVTGPDGPTPAAVVRDWPALRGLPLVSFTTPSDRRVLNLAISLATGEPVDLAANATGYSALGYGRVVMEAFTIASGADQYFTVAWHSEVER